MPDHAPDQISAEELLQLPLFEGENREAVEWIASQMEVRRYDSGDVMVREGDPAREFVVILEGEIHFRRGGHDNVLVGSAGEATGVLPFSRMKTWGGRGWAAQATRIAAMDASHLRELVYRAPLLAQRLVAEMTDRTREITRMEEGSNRLLALGKLAAGLAHELNNPASAAVRSSARLRDVLTDRRKHVLAMRGEVIPERAREIMASLGESIIECAATTPGSVDALERADRESELSDWLESAGAAWRTRLRARRCRNHRGSAPPACLARPQRHSRSRPSDPGRRPRDPVPYPRVGGSVASNLRPRPGRQVVFLHGPEPRC